MEKISIITSEYSDELGEDILLIRKSDLDALEGKLQEALKVLIKCQDELRSMGHESIALNIESSSPLLQEVRKVIKAVSGKSWQEIIPDPPGAST